MALLNTTDESTRALLTTTQGDSFYSDYGDSSLSDAIEKVNNENVERLASETVSSINLLFRDAFLDLVFEVYKDASTFQYWSNPTETTMTYKVLNFGFVNPIDINTSIWLFLSFYNIDQPDLKY